MRSSKSRYAIQVRKHTQSIIYKGSNKAFRLNLIVGALKGGSRISNLIFCY